MTTDACTDATLLDQWHVISATADINGDRTFSTRLLGVPLTCRRRSDGRVEVRRGDADGDLPATEAYGYLWTSLGTPPGAIFAIPEYAEADRRNIQAATIGVRVSAPRAIENFLDMGHFPYVHTGVLGVEPHTEVRDYDVEVRPDGEIFATRCRFFQPLPAAASRGGPGSLVEYVYRVPNPHCAVLYKSCDVDHSRMDVIALFVQAVDQDHCRANMMVSVVDDISDDLGIRAFQLGIFGQDKPILENQLPRRLPLDPRAETPIRADKSSIVYRRWLREHAVSYGTVPVAG